ncbi:hypothetical protein EYF80_022419 [Liparis tanakae]|uniref:Uncharacterized protein n=1 Tax=Liparis tanakae TaxID=230148 RepID=A0A4Z2HRA5_9TELE|nr:hypothetical protein EYF80_022419 [Liparis tanakae]
MATVALDCYSIATAPRRDKMATRMRQDLRVSEGGEELPAHAVGDDSVLQSKHVHGGDLQRRAVELLVFLTRAAETSDEDGEAEVEVRLQLLLLTPTQHGHERRPLTEAQDAIERTFVLHGFPHSRHAAVEPQAFLTLLLSAEAQSPDIRKPPTPRVLVASGSLVLFLRSF